MSDVNPKGVQCPHCGALPGESCVSKNGRAPLPYGISHLTRHMRAAGTDTHHQDEFGPLYQQGHLSIENPAEIAAMDQQDCLVGVQVASDGRIWLCVNGTAFIRFKPAR